MFRLFLLSLLKAPKDSYLMNVYSSFYIYCFSRSAFSFIKSYNIFALGIIYRKASIHICFSMGLAAISRYCLFDVVNVNCDDVSFLLEILKFRKDDCDLLRLSSPFDVSSTSSMSRKRMVRADFSSSLSFLMIILALLKHTLKYLFG